MMTVTENVTVMSMSVCNSDKLFSTTPSRNAVSRNAAISVVAPSLTEYSIPLASQQSGEFHQDKQKGHSAEKTKKKRLKVRMKKEMEPRADIPSRIGMSTEDFLKVPHRDPFVNKHILNDLKPVQLRVAMDRNNESFA